MKIYSIGHSTHSLGHFLSLLEEHCIRAVADVRAFPSSSRYPHFNRPNLERSLEKHGIRYAWLGRELGGYRKKSEGLGEASPNTGWDREGFRTYADHMLSESFARGIGRLLDLARTARTAFMCAEKHYWRCHRRLISDYLVSRGELTPSAGAAQAGLQPEPVEVLHILDPGLVRAHTLTPFAAVRSGRLFYPGPRREDLTLFAREREEDLPEKKHSS